MEDKLKEDKGKKEKLKRGEIIAVSNALLAKKGDMTAKERCEYNNVGRCGACDNDGIFVACA